MRAGSAFQNLQSITILLFSLKRFFPKNDLSKINTQSIKLYLSKKLSLFFKKNINKIKTKKNSFWNQRRYWRGQKPTPEFSTGKHDQREFPCSFETRVWGNDLIKNAKLAQLQNRSLEAANPPSKNDSLNTNRTNYPNLYDLLNITSHHPLSLRSKAERFSLVKSQNWKIMFSSTVLWLTIGNFQK